MNRISVSAEESSRRVAFNMVCNTAAHMLSAVIAFVITPFLIARIGLEAYGFYPISAEVVSLFAMLTGVVNATAGRYITVEDARGNRADANKYFSTVFFSNLILCSILLIPMGLFVTFLDHILSVPAEFVGQMRVFFALVLAAVPVNAVSAAFGSAYMISNRIDLRSGQELITVLLKAAVMFGLLGGGFSSSIVSVGIAIFLSTLAGAVIQYLMSRRLAPDLRLSIHAVSGAHARRVLTSGVWYTLDRLGAFLMTGALLLVCNVVFRSNGVGLYSVSLTASRFLGGVLMVLAGVFVPVTAKRFARGEKEILRREIVRNQKITGYFAAVCVAVCIGFCDEFFTLWIGDESFLLRLLTVLSVLPSVAIACALPIVDLGVVMNRMRRLSLLFVGSGLLTLATIISVACFTPFGVLGVAAVSALAQLVWYGVLVPLFAARILGMRAWKFYCPVLRCLGASVLSVGLVFAVKAVAPVSNWLTLAVMGSMCSVVSLAASFLVVFGKPKFKI